MDALKRSLGLNVTSPAQRRRRGSRNDPAILDGNGNGEDEADYKQKIMGLWHSMKYGRTLFALDSSHPSSLTGGPSPVWFLGVSYQGRMSSENRMTTNLDRTLIERTKPEPTGDSSNAAQEAFALDFSTRIWMTYRREFEEFHGTSLNTDCGWGCMIRSGQMLIANTLLLQRFGRTWRWRGKEPVMTSEDLESDPLHRALVRLFGDSSDSSTSPLSIHKLLSIAKSSINAKPGDWFGPSSTALLLRDAVAQSGHKLLEDLCVYVAKDCTVYKEDVNDICRNTARRRRYRRASSETSVQSEDYSIVDHPSEYPAGMIPGDGPQCGKGRLLGGIVDGVPYFEEAKEMCESPQVKPEDLAMEAEMKLCSLNQSVNIGGQEWIAEGPSSSLEPRCLVENQQLQQSSAPTANVDVRNLVSQSDPLQPYEPVKRTPPPAQQRHTVPQIGSTTSSSSPGTKVGPGAKRQSVPAPISRRASVLEEWTPVLILIPVRLGGEKLNPIYTHSVKTLLATDNCVGIIGGRPKHSLYFVGFQEDNLIHLDPHLVQQNVNVSRRNFPLDSFHCKTPRKMPISRMDPSCCLGFYCPSKENFDGWAELMSQIATTPGASSPTYPMFSVVGGRAEDQHNMYLARQEQERFQTVAKEAAGLSLDEDAERISEDFVFL